MDGEGMLDALRAEVAGLYEAADHMGYLLRRLGAPDRVIYSASAVRAMADRAGAFWLERSGGAGAMGPCVREAVRGGDGEEEDMNRPEGAVRAYVTYASPGELCRAVGASLDQLYRMGLWQLDYGRCGVDYPAWREIYLKGAREMLDMMYWIANDEPGETDDEEV